MISKEQFLAIKRMKTDGVPIAVIARKIGISEPTARKWANMSEAGFEALMRDDIPYLDNYREFILSILRVCPQTRETNILYRLQVHEKVAGADRFRAVYWSSHFGTGGISAGL